MLQLVTFPGAPDGMVRAVPQHDIPDTAAWTLADVFLNIPGFARRRGPVDSIRTIADAASIGLAATTDPSGTWVGLELVLKDGGGEFHGFENSTMVEDWILTPQTNPYTLFDARPALNGGVVIGTSYGYSKNSPQVVGLWRGASKGETSAVFLGANLARGDRQVTLESGGGTQFCPGHFLLASTGELIGVVESVSGDVLTLEHPALFPGTNGVTQVIGVPFRGIDPRVSKGRITCATTSTEVNGGQTRFRAQGLDNGTWDLFTTDYAYIGTVNTVNSDTQLELTGNAAVALLNSDYIAIKRAPGYSLSAGHVGWINAQYAGHQFYAKGNTVAFSDDDDPEALYLDAIDGDTIIFSDDDVRGMVAGSNGLVVLTENDAFVLLGAAGTTPDRWRGDRLHDDGTICGMTAITYKGGVVWAGRRGVWFWDGADPVNLVGNLGDAYARFVEAMPSGARAYGMIHNNHYFLHIEESSSTEFQVHKDSTTTLSRLTLCVNLRTGAATVLRNVAFRGVAEPPASVGDGETYYSITTADGKAAVCKATSLFEQGLDEHACAGHSSGPDLYVETKKYDMGDEQRLKLFKMLLLHYQMGGTVHDAASIAAGTADHLRFATVKGLDTDGEVSTTKLFIKEGGSPTWQNKRVKFMKRNQFLALRMWQGTTTITQLVLGAWAVGFKWKRPGRV